jgi:anti-anti-sigma factor
LDVVNLGTAFLRSFFVFGIDSHLMGGRAVVQLRGELDVATEAQLASELDRVIARNPDVVVVDLRDLTFMDCRGMRSLVMARRRCEREGRKLLLVRGTPIVHRVLSLCGVETQFDTVEDAWSVPAQGTALNRTRFYGARTDGARTALPATAV